MLASLQTAVSGAATNFFWKYGDLADKINLCKFHTSEEAVKLISDVFGVLNVSNEYICEARGCSGSVLLE